MSSLNPTRVPLMIGAQKHSHFSLNHLVLILLFAVVGVALAACGQYKDKDAPESAKGDLNVRAQYLQSLETKGLAQKSEKTFKSRSYDGYQFEGCTLSQETVRHNIESVTESEIRMSVTYMNPKFAAPRNAQGESCSQLYTQIPRNELQILDTVEETNFRKAFIEDGCGWIQGELGKSLPAVEMQTCTITFKREENFSEETVGSARLEAVFTDQGQEFPINELFVFFLNRLLWVDQFNGTGSGFLVDSDGNRQEYSYQESLNSIGFDPEPTATLSSEQARSSQQAFLERLRSLLQ